MSGADGAAAAQLPGDLALALRKIEDLERNVADVWIILCTFFIISMQLGFAMLEVGSVREAHRMTVLVKNVMDSAVSCLSFWAHLHWASDALVVDSRGPQPHLIVMQWAFCSCSVTICSGSMAERTHVLAYLCFASVMATLIYPVTATSAWTNEGLLHREFHNKFHNGYPHHDFSGGGVVHVTGGTAALVGAIILGRRIVRPLEQAVGGALHRVRAPASPSGSRLSPNSPCRRVGAHVEELKELQEQDERSLALVRPSGGWQRRFDSKEEDAKEFTTCAYLQVMGMFTLWIGWYGFNAGSTRCMNRACAATAATVSWNTTLSACSAGCGAYLFSYSIHKHLSTGFLCNGVLSGLVAINAPCDVATEGAAVIIGLTAGLLVYPLSSHLIQRAFIDDPVDAIAVHACCGAFGVLAASFCIPDCQAIAVRGGMPEQLRFCAEDHSIAKQFLAQVWGLFTEIWWSAIISLVLWSAFAVAELTRALEVEELTQANELLCQMVTPAPEPQAETDALWAKVASRSTVARRVLHRHGWRGTRFDAGWPQDVWQLRLELQQARGERAETALEVEFWLVLRWLALGIHSCKPLRELPLLRLRISPVSEIYGWGHADLDGGQLYKHLQKAVAQMSETQREHSPLKTEVRELALAVQSQESVLRALVRGGNRRGGRDPFWPRTLHEPSVASVPEQDPSDGALEAGGVRASASASASVPHPREARSGLAYAPSFVVAHARGSGASVASASSDRTVSDRSAGNLSPRSAAEETPPPSLLGRPYAGLRPVESVAPSQINLRDANVQDITIHLMNMMTAQQHLLAALQPAPTPVPYVAGAPAMHVGPATAGANGSLLLNALQQVAAYRPGSSTPDSGSTLEDYGLLVPSRHTSRTDSGP